MTAVARRAYVGLGANIGEPRAQIAAAVAALDRIETTRLLRVSSLYRSRPVGYAEQPDFLNAVAAIETTLEARALLGALLGIERGLGRSRQAGAIRNGPRTIDLDLLLYGDASLAEVDLIVPHPRMHERAFVLCPLAEIAPEVLIPGIGRASEVAAWCDWSTLERVGAA